MFRSLKLTVVFLLLSGASITYAQGIRGKSFGFGLILGEPTGGTIKIWTAPDQALTGSIGASYFGAPRINADYIWHFNSFNSDIVKLYVGPGLCLGMGEGVAWYYDRKGKPFYVRDSRASGIGARVMLGLNIIPHNTPIELFFEAGPLVGLSPNFGAVLDVGLGIRFYP